MTPLRQCGFEQLDFQENLIKVNCCHPLTQSEKFLGPIYLNSTYSLAITVQEGLRPEPVQFSISRTVPRRRTPTTQADGLQVVLHVPQSSHPLSTRERSPFSSQEKFNIVVMALTNISGLVINQSLFIIIIDFTSRIINNVHTS